jgi:hypothetical protein
MTATHVPFAGCNLDVDQLADTKGRYDLIIPHLTRGSISSVPLTPVAALITVWQERAFAPIWAVFEKYG